jgi:hypothetical protein
MAKVIVNNPNIFLESSYADAGIGAAALRSAAPAEDDLAAVRLLRQFRREIEELACSAAWAEDCLFRGARYAPDFRCQCSNCRKFFPNRLHPRSFRESRYSIDCQVETDEDPEFAEEFARLRNDRPRFGSVFARHPRISMGKNQISAED